MEDTAAGGPAWLLHASLGRPRAEPGAAEAVVTGLLAVSPAMPATLTSRLELDGEPVATTWELPSPAVRRRHPEAANGARARFRATAVPSRSGVLELVVQDSRTGERTTLVTRHVVPPGPGARSVERVLDRMEELRATGERDDASYARLRRLLRRVPEPDRGVEWDEARVLLDALFQRAARPTHRRLRALRDVRRAAGQEAEFAAFWTRLGRVTHPLVLSPHGYQVPLSARDEGAVWREAARLADHLERLGHPSYVSYGTLLGLVRGGGLIAHDDDVDLTVVLEGETFAEVVCSWLAFKADAAGAGLLRLDYEAAPRAHSKLVAAEGLSVDVFPAWVMQGRLFAWPNTFGGLDPADLLPLEPREVCGTVVRVPRRPEALLAEMYGPGWATPDPAHRFDWKAADERFAPFLDELHRAYDAGR